MAFLSLNANYTCEKIKIILSCLKSGTWNKGLQVETVPTKSGCLGSLDLVVSFNSDRYMSSCRGVSRMVNKKKMLDFHFPLSVRDLDFVCSWVHICEFDPEKLFFFFSFWDYTYIKCPFTPRHFCHPLLVWSPHGVILIDVVCVCEPLHLITRINRGGC